MHGIKTLESRLHYSIVGYHRFISCHYPERLEDERPLFPMTVHDVCVYIDYKIQHCLYSSMQKHISVLQHHPDHGEWWKHQVLENLMVLKKMIHHRELEEAQTGTLHNIKKGEEEIEGLLSTKSIGFLKDDDDDNSDDNCTIVTGATKGFMITSAKPSIKKQVTMKSNSIMSYKKSILSSKKGHHRIEKPLSKQRKIKNGFYTVNMDVNEWANRVSIVPSVTPIALRPLPSIPRHTAMVTIKTLASSSSFSTFSSPSPSLSIVPLSP